MKLVKTEDDNIVDDDADWSRSNSRGIGEDGNDDDVPVSFNPTVSLVFVNSAEFIITTYRAHSQKQQHGPGW